MTYWVLSGAKNKVFPWKVMVTACLCFLLLIMLHLMRREHKHRHRGFNWGIAKTVSAWTDFKMFRWCNFPFQAWSEVRLAAGWIAEQRLSTLASNSPILCSRIPDMSSPQPVRTWTMCASESGQLQSEIRVFMMKLLFSVLFPKTWSEFVTCIKQYTSDCLTSDQVRSRSYFTALQSPT